MTQILAISNQAGGVGKTTTSINLSGALNELGHKVLLVDADPQGTATEGVGFRDLYSQKIPSLHQVMVDPSRTSEINDIIQHHEEFDIIPANKSMDALKDMLLTQVANSEMRLKIALDELDTDYDFIIIDCPPDLSQILDNALLAAENLLIPVEPTRRSIRAIEKMNEEISYLESSFPGQIDQIRVRGIVVNSVEGTPNNDTKEMLEFFNDAPYPVFQIPERVAIRRAWNNGVSIFQHDDPAKVDDARESYLSIARELAAEEVKA
ncbi:ParA family protein [Halogeometricum sp. S1BR25-6]|uniref:ParA family protein n=1 Tax=Halogeometricum salsisoli TaxID=2950536 RepID=A0ABU2GJM8_9EURY|nr:ParA family protein [Halogeometricum sp. S1BR25-6]MDS0300980.1 ParA family protein [Halogeometricum sp. S1BR25-6]